MLICNFTEQYYLAAERTAKNGKVKSLPYAPTFYLMNSKTVSEQKSTGVATYRKHKFSTFIRQSSFGDDRTFSGFKSRCIMPFSWRYYTERDWPPGFMSRHGDRHTHILQLDESITHAMATFSPKSENHWISALLFTKFSCKKIFKK